MTDFTAVTFTKKGSTAVVNRLGSIDWIAKTDGLDRLLDNDHSLTLHPMEQGFEAEVMKISSGAESFVLKIWNKRSRPDIGLQFRLLHTLYEQGFAVSRPIGWGIHASTDNVLLTTFDGLPVRKLNKPKMAGLALILSRLHQISSEQLHSLQLPKHPFVDYFYRDLQQHPDLAEALHHLLNMTLIRQNRLIHGDFHLNNLVEAGGRYTVIDWTNVQLGDARYDFAWSLVLQKLYIPQAYAPVFQAAYMSHSDMEPEEVSLFEAIAYIRWVLLYRTGGAPAVPGVPDRASSLAARNPFLKQLQLNLLLT